jgi:hypothetical protein
MSNRKVSFKTEKERQQAILEEKIKGTPDLEIGQRYGVTFRYIERLITKSQGVNISSLSTSKKIKTLYPKDFKEEQIQYGASKIVAIGLLIVGNIEATGLLTFLEM